MGLPHPWRQSLLWPTSAGSNARSRATVLVIPICFGSSKSQPIWGEQRPCHENDGLWSLSHGGSRPQKTVDPPIRQATPRSMLIQSPLQHRSTGVENGVEHIFFPCVPHGIREEPAAALHGGANEQSRHLPPTTPPAPKNSRPDNPASHSAINADAAPAATWFDQC
jgi:hypothetical protein